MNDQNSSIKLRTTLINVGSTFIFFCQNIDLIMQLDEQVKSKYNGFQTSKKNYIWAGAMSLAWQQLKSQVIKEPIKLQTKDPKILQMIENFNLSNFLKKDLSPESYYIKSGFGQQAASLINKQVSQKFKQMTVPKIEEKLQKTDLISYAYIFKKFPFLSQFQRRQVLSFSFNGSKVESFYAQELEQKKIVFYYNYESDANFLIGIKGKINTDSIFMMKSQKELTIDQVIKTVIHAQSKGTKRYLTPIDQFQMPLIKIQANRHLKQLEGLKFENQSCNDCYMAKAIEGLKFQIDQKGAKMENYAVIMRKKCKLEVKKPKRFLLNKPFWIIMKQKQKHPYLCIKVQNPIDCSTQQNRKKSI